MEFVIAFGVSPEHEPSVKACTGQQPHIYINEEEFDDKDENFKSPIYRTESEVKKALESSQTESEVTSEALQSKSCSKSSVGSTSFPVLRVSSFTDLLRWKEGKKSSLRLSKSEGNISSNEALVKDCTAQQLLYICEYEEELQSDETVRNYSPSINQTEPEVTGAGSKIDSEVEPDNQCRSVFVLRSMPDEQRRRSFSDSTTLNTPRIFTAEHLRKTKSYTTFPHINTQSVPRDDELSSFVHRTSCFRIMPHLSGDCLADENFPTVSVLSLSSLFENYAQNIECEISSESEDSLGLGASEEGVLHSWRKPSSRPRSYSEPVSMAPELPVRTWSLPNMEEKRLSRFQETIYKVKASPSRLILREQALEKLKEEASSLSLGLSLESVKSCSSSVMSLVDNYDSEVIDQWFSSQECLGGEDVMGHWINRTRARRHSITKEPSFSLVEEAEEGEGDLQKTPSAVSLVNQVTEQVLSSCEVNVSTESSDDRSTTVEGAVKLWKKKEPGRRATLASVSPLTDSPKYASEIEQQAFRKIKKWKDSFALKLNNVLGERFQEMAAKRDEELARKKKPKVLKVPMNLSDKEMGQLKNNLLLELKRKSVGSDDHEDLARVPPPSPLPIPRVKFPRRASSDQKPADLRVQMMEELSRRVSFAGDNEDALHCYKPSSLVPDLLKTLPQTKRQGVVYIPSGTRSTTLDPDSIRDLLSWHEAERKRLKAELEGLPQAQWGEKQVLIDRNDANKVLQSMMKIMEEIFTGTIMRFMGSGEPVSNADPTGNEGRDHVIQQEIKTVLTPTAHVVQQELETGNSRPDK
ncbi:uncharacterized protein LOC110064425 isoform X4 [Orbicella faveolata]|nr:uncharacterized protein LOC110064425 isoform X4 [Orbicella faveolata]